MLYGRGVDQVEAAASVEPQEAGKAGSLAHLEEVTRDASAPAPHLLEEEEVEVEQQQMLLM